MLVWWVRTASWRLSPSGPRRGPWRSCGAQPQHVCLRLQGCWRWPAGPRKPCVVVDWLPAFPPQPRSDGRWCRRAVRREMLAWPCPGAVGPPRLLCSRCMRVRAQGGCSVRSSQGQLCPAASEPEAVDDGGWSPPGPQPEPLQPFGGVGEEQPRTGGSHTAGGRLREAVLESLSSLGRAGALSPSAMLDPGSARRPRRLCHGGGRKLCEAGRAPVGQPRPCPPPALASSFSCLVASATTSGLWLRHVASLGSPRPRTPRAIWVWGFPPGLRAARGWGTCSS